MTILSLKDKDLFPDGKVLGEVLGSAYAAWEKLNDFFTHEQIVPQWRFYRDGNVWLCKMWYKKKNLGWIHTYDGYFNVTCYFNLKYFSLIGEQLEVSESVKNDLYHAKPFGKISPMTISVKSEELPAGLCNMIRFRKNLK